MATRITGGGGPQQQPQQRRQQQQQQQQQPQQNRPQRHHTALGQNWPPLFESTREIDKRIGRVPTSAMNKDAHFTSLHLHRARDADLLEAFAKDRLPADDIYVPAHHQPVNPEDEDDVVPDQHAAFGIQKATALRREPAWRDFGLAELMAKGPEPGAWGKGGAKGKFGSGGPGAGAPGGKKGPSRLPR
ncbi:hypothetical protein KVR01_011122 [Diaporthe batatas]|uniref:uncharacterized protein n=1 Tax=Diaporthe batatas TaxID=748121 RepID=UPI001D049B97|nr:uncharacterized protein KVR01_011122 [Diaporthe batatas]KAG8159461.1 hypothetical protein KVR01_011122 [Diaporthe batatas]